MLGLKLKKVRKGEKTTVKTKTGRESRDNSEDEKAVWCGFQEVRKGEEKGLEAVTGNKNGRYFNFLVKSGMTPQPKL